MAEEEMKTFEVVLAFEGPNNQEWQRLVHYRAPSAAYVAFNLGLSLEQAFDETGQKARVVSVEEV